MKRTLLILFCVICGTSITTAETPLEKLKESFREAAVASVSGSPEVAGNFLRYSDYGRANDVLLLQLYTSVALPDEEIDRLKGLWSSDHFTDIDYSNQDRGRWQPTLHVTRLQALAKVYSNPDSKWYKNSSLNQMLHAGIGWWFKNMPVCPNWWHNDIGVPKKMSAILLMLSDELSEDEIQKGLKVLEYAKFGMSGQNKCWLASNQLMKGILTGDEKLVLRARDVIAEEISMSTEGEGILDDWSFHQHGPQIQFGNYGLAYLENMSFWLRVLEGTAYQFADEQCAIIVGLMEKGIGWCVWKGMMDPSYCGRQNFPDAGRGKAYALAVSAQNLSVYWAKKGRSTEAESFRALSAQNLNPEEYANSLVGAKYFPHSDCGIYRTPTWYASSRMSSTRTEGYEFTNRENTLAHFSASGAVLVMRSGEEYDNIFACWDWRKVPGVTAYDDGKPLRSSNRRLDKQNNSDAVWGRTFIREDGSECLETHMELRKDSLVAKKSVLFTPDFILEEGSGIRTINPEVRSVTTCINQTLLKGPVRRGWVHLDSCRHKWVWHDRTAYVILDGKHLRVSTDVQTGDWGKIDPALTGRADSLHIFKIWLEHPDALSSSGKEDSYKFLIFPDVKSGEIKAKVKAALF